MKKTLYIILINLVLVIFQNSFFPEIFGVNFNPNLILAFGFSFLFINLEEEGRTSLLIGGLLIDLLGFNTLGLSSFIFLILFELSILIRKYLTKGIFTQLLLLLVSNILYILITGLNYPYFAHFSQILIVSILTTLSCLIFYFLESNLLRLFTRSELGLLKNPYK